jgi:hypothetical protein
LYYNLVFAVERLCLHVNPDEKLDREDSKWELMNGWYPVEVEEDGLTR